MDKKALRKSIKQIRNSLPESERKSQSILICKKLLELDEYKKANKILSFMNFGSEIEIENFNQKIKNLSGGMKRRVAIARALAYGGEVLILDEAFNGLDEKIKLKTISIIKKYTKNKSIILISHNLEDFNRFEIENFISTQ